jgi:hypothetical protein
MSLCLSVCLSVRKEQLGSHWTNFHKIWYLIIPRNAVEKIQVWLNPDKNNGYFTWRHVAMIIYRVSLLRMRNFSDKSCADDQNTHLMFSIFFNENRTVYELLWKITGERSKPQMTIWRIRFACWINKATDIHSKYVILIAFPRQKMVERTLHNVTTTLPTLSSLWGSEAGRWSIPYCMA